MKKRITEKKIAMVYIEILKYLVVALHAQLGVNKVDRKAKIIILEGTSGSGKTTQLERTKIFLELKLESLHTKFVAQIFNRFKPRSLIFLDTRQSKCLLLTL